MPFVIGQKKTNELLFTGDMIEAEEAERIGMVNRVVPDARWWRRSRSWSTRSRPPRCPCSA